MKASVIITSGSTEVNAHVRANCLWKCVNSMHEDPGAEFELIIIDNCHGSSVHRDAIEEIWHTYKNVTHVIRNRVNEFHGGGVRQGLYVADGQVLVQCADDIRVAPGWLKVLCDPLVEHPDQKLVGTLGPGINVKARRCGLLQCRDRQYRLLDRAGAYCWAIRKTDYQNNLPPWYRKHFADTRMANKMSERGFKFSAPIEPGFLKFTNANYLRPWDYKDKRNAPMFKEEYIQWVWRKGVLAKKPHVPVEKYPLKNDPAWTGPQDYPEPPDAG